MKFCIIFVLFFTATSFMNIVGGFEALEYGSLIKNIYDTYGTAGIIIASSVNYQSFSPLTSWHRISRMLSDKAIPMGVVKFGQVKERLDFYSSQTVRPLVVILVSTMKAFYNFEKLASNLDMGYPVWLILFTAEPNSDVCKFCRAPYKNLLKLKFNTEAIISCCGSEIIDEWWSEMENHTNTRKLGKWISDKHSIELFSKDSLYGRRSSVHGRRFRVGVVKGSSYFWKHDGKFYGLLGELLQELSQSMNFTVSSLDTDVGCGSWNSETSKWSGVIGRVRRKEADMAISEFSMTNKRLDMVDFTIPIVVGYARLYIQKPYEAGVKWNAYFKAFAMDVWMVIIGMILIMPLFLTLIKYQKKMYKYHFFSLIAEHYSYVWGIYCQQALSEFPNETPLRIVYVSIFISSLVVSAAYAASLISFLAVSSLYLPFNTMEQFAEDGSYKLIVLKDSSDYDTFRTSNETILYRMMSLMKPNDELPLTLDEGFHQVCSGKVAFLTNEAMKDAMINPIPCELASINTGRIETLGMIMPLRSEYTDLVNFHIQRFRDNGILERLKRKYFRPDISPELPYPPVDHLGIAPILCILTGGFLIAFIIFLVEHMFHHIGDKIRHYRKKHILIGKKKVTPSFHF